MFNNRFKIKTTLPSGRDVSLAEIKNDLYFALHKFILNDDVQGFYDILDEHVAETVEDMKNLDLYDKFYIYLALYTYSIRSTIELKPTSIELFAKNRSYTLFDSLDALIENRHTVPERVSLENIQTKIGTVDLILGIPKTFDIEEGKAVFDPVSAVYSLRAKGEEFNVRTEEDREALENGVLTIDNYVDISKKTLESFNIKIPLVKDNIEVPLLNPYTFINLAKTLYYSDLNHQFDLEYVCLRHLNMQPSEFMFMTPADSLVLWLKFVAEKEEEKKRSENGKNGPNDLYL